jgi:gluconokinase
MGVSGCGKSSVGEKLAQASGSRFLEGDSFHPESNVAKMKAGVPLNDDDRWPWLDLLGRHLRDGNVVLSCSSLKGSYRDRLRSLSGHPLIFVFLHGERELLEARVCGRSHEYMPSSLLESQLATLEVPHDEADVVSINIDQPLEIIVASAAEAIAERVRP